MRDRGDRFSRRLVAAMAIAYCSAPGCSCAGDPPMVAPQPARTDDSAGARVLNVGNPSRGLDEQPDYDGQARALRDRLAPRLPDPLPSSQQACAAMLDAAVELYAKAEVDATSQRAALRATRDADLQTCQADTSPAAASCVRLLLAEQAGEWPWLLDQCSRAFPRG